VPKTSFVPNYKRIADTLRRHILYGNYAIKPIPSERQLAEEFGVNYMTVRRSFQTLLKEQLLMRQPNGRMRVKRVQQGAKKHLNFAFLMPTMFSHALELWRNAIERATAGRTCIVRPLLYMHWDDPILIDSLEGFDGIFLSPIPEPLPNSMANRLREPHHPVAVVDHDFTHHGIPSIRLFSPSFVQKLLNHLESLGHAEIGCFNTQPEDSEVLARIEQWRLWMAIHRLPGRLISSPVRAHGDPMPHACEVMNKILAGERKETAWFCITTPAAVGAMRAMLDHGLMPGRDLAVCTANGERVASLLNPPLTALEAMDPTPFVNYCLDWMSKGGGAPWQGPLLMQPAEVPLIIRESTQPGAGRGLSADAKAPKSVTKLSRTLV
jgi:DNA-binding transcriptional regulator YhcF (GntR family)